MGTGCLDFLVPSMKLYDHLLHVVARCMCALSCAGLRETVEGGSYTLVLEFKSSFDYSKWEAVQGKFQSFFGPGIIARMEKTDAGANVFLVADGSGTGRGGKEQKDVLLPLMPGLPARRQD